MLRPNNWREQLVGKEIRIEWVSVGLTLEFGRGKGDGIHYPYIHLLSLSLVAHCFVICTIYILLHAACCMLHASCLISPAASYITLHNAHCTLHAALCTLPTTLQYNASPSPASPYPTPLLFSPSPLSFFTFPLFLNSLLFLILSHTLHPYLLDLYSHSYYFYIFNIDLIFVLTNN